MVKICAIIIYKVNILTVYETSLQTKMPVKHRKCVVHTWEVVKLFQLHTSYWDMISGGKGYEKAIAFRMRIFNNAKYCHIICLKLWDTFFTSFSKIDTSHPGWDVAATSHLGLM